MRPVIRIHDDPMARTASPHPEVSTVAVEAALSGSATVTPSSMANEGGAEGRRGRQSNHNQFVNYIINLITNCCSLNLNVYQVWLK